VVGGLAAAGLFVYFLATRDGNKSRLEAAVAKGSNLSSVSLTKRPDGTYDGTGQAKNGGAEQEIVNARVRGREALWIAFSREQVKATLREAVKADFGDEVASSALDRDPDGNYSGQFVTKAGVKGQFRVFVDRPGDVWYQYYEVDRATHPQLVEVWGKKILGQTVKEVRLQDAPADERPGTCVTADGQKYDLTLFVGKEPPPARAAEPEPEPFDPKKERAEDWLRRQEREKLLRDVRKWDKERDRFQPVPGGGGGPGGQPRETPERVKAARLSLRLVPRPQ
jgi:hypothetical protein